MEKIAEFKSKVSRKGRSFYILVPSALTKAFEKYHGHKVYVEVYLLSEEVKQ